MIVTLSRYTSRRFRTDAALPPKREQKQYELVEEFDRTWTLNRIGKREGIRTVVGSFAAIPSGGVYHGSMSGVPSTLRFIGDECQLTIQDQ